jgi:hypothetical protein
MGIQGRGGRFGVQATQGAPKPLGAKPITHWRGHARREMAKQKDPPKAVCLSVESGPLVLRRWRFWDAREHSDLPNAAFSNVHARPKSVYFNRCTG